MVKSAIVTEGFQRSVGSVRDAKMRERIEKMVRKLIASPETGKPLKYHRKGERSAYIGPFRLVYTLQGETIIFLGFGHRKCIYER